MDYSARLNTLRKQFKDQCQALLISDSNNIKYLCGFTGSCGKLLVTARKAYFFTDFRYEQQSLKEVCSDVKIEIIKHSMLESLRKIKSLKIKRLGIERNEHLSTYLILQEIYKDDLVIVGKLPERLRQIKSSQEMSKIRKAFAIADESFNKLLKIIKPGMKETNVAAHLEFYMKELGSEQPSFATIVASGVNAACPHAKPGNKKLKKNEMVKIDFGAVFEGYHSDMTRTIFLGKATKKFEKIYNIVLKAQSEAVKALKPGVKCSEVDGVARDVISKAGYEKYFGHGLGHALGLDVHEMPALSQKCDRIIEPGMIFTVEPGIYLPDWGGVRIEDVYLVKEKGLEKLTKTPNKLKEL